MLETEYIGQGKTFKTEDRDTRDDTLLERWWGNIFEFGLEYLAESQVEKFEINLCCLTRIQRHHEQLFWFQIHFYE